MLVNHQARHFAPVDVQPHGADSFAGPKLSVTIH
jgi:hypothetical protein